MQAVLRRRNVLVGMAEAGLSTMSAAFLWQPSLLFGAHLAFVAWMLRAPDPAPPSAWFTLLWPVPLSVSVVYVSLTQIGVKFMEARSLAAEWATEWLFVFNIHQVVVHALIAASLARHVHTSPHMAVWGNEFSHEWRDERLATLIWLHYYVKFVELLDTLFVVVRRKGAHLTLLHVYQRVVLLWSWFIAVSTAPGGDTYFGACVNSTLQVVTYLYHLFTLLGVRFTRKRNVTRLHMVSFVVCGLHSVFVLWRGNMPASLATVQLLVMLNMLGLYTNFHYEEFAKPKRRQARGGNAKQARLSKGHSSSSISASSSQGAHAGANSDSESDVGAGAGAGAAVGDSAAPRPRVVFSFDSSGWGYVYHFGVALYILQHVAPKFQPFELAFSGSSGGSLVAALLCIDVPKDRFQQIVDHVISCQPQCALNPWRMLPCAEEAMRVYLPKDAHHRCSNRLRVLLTRVLPRYPFVMGEVATKFESWQDLFVALRGSCHVPLVGGLLPYAGAYYDGMFWSSVFVSWRTKTPLDCVVKCSAIGMPTAQIKPSVPIPTWWMLIPPNEHLLRCMCEMGYADAARFFSFWTPRHHAASLSATGTPQQQEQFQEIASREYAFPRVAVDDKKLVAFRDAAIQAWASLVAVLGVTTFVSVFVFWYFS